MFSRGGSSKPALDTSAQRLLFVEVVEARGLIAVNKNNTSDPYAVAALQDLGGRNIKTETFYTKQKNATITPNWGESLTFGANYTLDSATDLPTLSVGIFHKAAFSVSETPLGTAFVPLDHLEQDGTQVDKWYPLEPTGRMKNAGGQVHLRLRFNRAPTKSADSDDDLEIGEATKLLEEPADSGLTAEETEDQSPNELHVTVCRAKNLLAMDKPLLFSGPGSSDPQTRIKIDGFDTKKTKFIRKTLNPTWDEELVWSEVVNPALSLTVIVEDHNDVKPTCDFIGAVAIPLNEFDTKKPIKRWYKLRTRDMTADGVERGEVELLIHWQFNVKVKQEMMKKEEKKKNSALGQLKSNAKSFRNQMGKLAGVQNEDSDDDFDDETEAKDADEPERGAKKTPEQEEEEKKKEQEKQKELSDIEIKDGDYQVQVHIIEARELKAENADGTSDPIVFVECFGQKRNTIVIKQSTSCVFDELFIFNLPKLDKSAFEDGLIRISCYDSTIMSMLGGKNKMIGAFAIDAPMVYTMNKDHEMYRQWVPLIDDEDPEDVGVQGYLKISIAIVGPGEKVKVHDEDAERAAEIAKESAAGSDIGSLCLSTPTIQKEWKFLVVRVHKGDGLPVMDGKVGAGIVTLSDAKTDAFCKLSFAGGKPVKTKVVTCVGSSRTQITPPFDVELWYPVSLPTMTQAIKFSIWDWDANGNELIANVTENFNKIKKAPMRSGGLQWYNMYGAPEFKQEKLIANVAKGITAVAKKAKQTLGADINWGEFYNNSPDKASAYKGRVLMQFSIQDKRPPKYDKPEVKPFRRRIKPLKSTQEPAQREYGLQALVICGNELPSSKAPSLTSTQYRVRVTCGINEICTKPVKLDGNCRWNELLKSEKILLPVDLSQVPDIFVYLVRDDGKPICFTRFPACTINPESKQKELMGFNQKAEWYLLREDKSIDALADDMFPGSLLIKLGFGLYGDMEQSLSKQHWSQCLENAKTNSSHQVRLHVYQARNVPAADSNGLCDPYLKVEFMGKKLETKICKKTLFPVYYQTLVFDKVDIPAGEDYLYASQICMRLMDHDDFDSDDYLGTAQLPLSVTPKGNKNPCAFLTPLDKGDVNDVSKFPLPTWQQFFYELPGDSQGEILVSVQLIPLFGQTLPSTNLPSIVPATKPAFIEFIAIGIRDMAPFNFQSMQAPFMEITLESFDTRYKSATQSSKRPDPSNPNFLERLVIPVQLPVDSIYTTPLQIQAKDTRLGGYLKPIVGVCQIDLSTKLPWCPDTYIAPQKEVFFQSVDDRAKKASTVDMAMDPALAALANSDAVAQKTRALQKERDAEKKADDFIASAEPISVDQFVQERVAADDTGAGVFGALNHIDFVGSKKKKGAENAFTDPDWGEDDTDQPPAWLVGRKKLSTELEFEFKTTPFETYSLLRGQVNGFLGSKIKTVGRLKGLVRVIEDRSQIEKDPILPPQLMEQLLKPKKYVVRLYALRAFNLEEMDVDIFGNKAKSDPYLKVKLGKNIFNDRKNAVDDVLEVDLYKLVTFETELPGVSQLNIEVFDKDLIGKDDLIGRTVVDLEDRWFDDRWQEWGYENMITPGQDLTDPSKVRWKTKPIECRTLYAPGFTLGRGNLECWVDLMTPEEAITFPPDDVSLPPKQIFEVRVVIWKTKDVPPMDSLEGMSDLFVKAWPEGCDPQETDTHWRCKKGKASFNWRMLFDVELGHNTRAMKFPYFHLQLWDRDLLKWNDCAGEGVIDLGKYFRKAYKKNICLKLFEKPQGKAAKRAKAKQLQQRTALIEDVEDDIPSSEDEDGTEKDDQGVELVTSPMRDLESGNLAMLPPRDKADSDDDDDVSHSVDTGLGAIPRSQKKKVEHQMLLQKPTKLSKKKAEKVPVSAPVDQETKPEPSFASRLMFWKKKESEQKNEDEQGLIENEEKKDEEKKEDEDQEARDMVTTFKNMTGLWDIDPDDSTWYHLENRDKNDPTKVTPMGSICYSIQIWPKDKATLMPVGSARSEPNTNPFLPPPVGRLKFSWNPFVLGSELCGPALCAKFFCCLLCIAFILLMIFCQPFLNIIINLIFVVY